MHTEERLSRFRIEELLRQIRKQCRLRHYSVRTEESYIRWINQFLVFTSMRNPAGTGKAEITAFLTHLAGTKTLAPSTQNQALSSLVFLYRTVLKGTFPWLDDLHRAKRNIHIPTIFSKAEVKAVLQQLEGTKWIMANLLYGSGLRLMECLNLRIRDIHFPQKQIDARDGKGRKDRTTLLPELLIFPLQRHLDRIQALHQQDLRDGFGAVDYPHGSPDHPSPLTKSWHWQYVFPSSKRSYDPDFQTFRRFHAHEAVLQRAIKDAIRAAALTKPGSCQTLRHSFAVHMLESGYNARVVQELLGHKNINTTMIYTQISNRTDRSVRSPIDELEEFGGSRTDRS